MPVVGKLLEIVFFDTGVYFSTYGLNYQELPESDSL
jgi:hypothetical protein